MIYAFPRFTNKDLATISLDELTEQCSQEILCALMENGGKGMKQAVAQTIAKAISRQELKGNMNEFQLKSW
jgi:hypothetical protein